jgi:thymidylate synthase
MTLSQNTADEKPSNGFKSINHEENQYLDLVREILESGERRPDRYGQKLQSKPSNGLTIPIALAQEHTPSLLLDR